MGCLQSQRCTWKKATSTLVDWVRRWLPSIWVDTFQLSKPLENSWNSKLKTQKRKLLKTQAKLLKREEGSESNVCPSTGAGMCVPSYCQFPFSDLGTMAQIPVSSDIQACRRQTVGLLYKDLRINQFHLDIWSVYRMCMCLHIECIYVSVLEYYF